MRIVKASRATLPLGTFILATGVGVLGTALIMLTVAILGDAVSLGIASLVWIAVGALTMIAAGPASASDAVVTLPWRRRTEDVR